MRIVTDPVRMQAITRRLTCRGKQIGLVPTMGALHEGHASLIRRSVRDNDVTVVSIFVNPIQFGPREDLARYPRSMRNDTAACKRLGVDFIFAPSVRRMYPDGFQTSVSVRDLSSVLCGVLRPGHFQGVATVVAKLLTIVGPRKAYFGQKDAQQAAIIRRMTSDLNLPITIEVLPIVREAGGLALSSRNQYLSANEKCQARVLYDALCLARTLVRQGVFDSRRIIARMRKIILRAPHAKIDYLAVVDPEKLTPVGTVEKKALVACAVWIGRTRLIDNCFVYR